ncbi:hypothetical protein [Candidatus Odyssella thessalonicensis]|uniref:hypothetical protein n=1 Tax=Candidatus Odyssella thessalonicensis TaxID=84647 RepID=UPI001112075C|nr:hypothetical protein [Candidatus Odyssella thessalonicensis]
MKVTLLKVTLLIAGFLSAAGAMESETPFSNKNHFYTYSEVTKAFEGIVLPEVKEEFEDFIALLFNHTSSSSDKTKPFPPSVHKGPALAQCWECIFEGMNQAQHEKDPVQTQRNVFGMFITHHVKSLRRRFPEKHEALEPYIIKELICSDSDAETEKALTSPRSNRPLRNSGSDGKSRKQ